MIAAWMLYSVLIGALAALAAWALERALRINGRPARGVWILALVVTVCVPAVVAWAPRPSEAPVRPAAASGTVPTVLAPLRALGEVTLTARPGLQRMDVPLGAFWLATSFATLAILGGGTLRLMGSRKHWTPAKVEETPVLVSDDFGPALVGIRRPDIVLPRWALELPPGERALVVAHEREHRKAGDTRLLTGAAVLLLTMPWNPALLWQFRRLRRAVEMDCDGRVLRAGASPRAYGHLLLELGARLGTRGPLVATLTEPVTFLERRIRMITTPSFEHAARKTVLALGLAAVAVLVACEAPAPTEVPGESAAIEVAVPRPPAGILREAPEPPRERPLIIIDGVITSKALADIDALDVASIEVIKGEAALSLYGERAQNGVIHITTKGEAQPSTEGAGGESGTSPRPASSRPAR